MSIRAGNHAHKVLTRGLSPCACKDILKGKQGKLKGTNIYFNVARELINSNPKMKKIFEDKIKCSQRVCPPVSVISDMKSEYICNKTINYLNE